MNILDITNLKKEEKTNFGIFLMSLGKMKGSDGFRTLGIHPSLIDYKIYLDGFSTYDLCKMHNFFKDIGYPELSEQILNYLKL